MSVVRISSAKFDLSHLAAVERHLVESEHALHDPIISLPGLIAFYAAIDRVRGVMTNVSLWDSLEHAHQLDTLQAMLAQRPIFEAAGVTFEPITNHEMLWTIRPPGR